ncbi:MAG: archease, partial [Nitrospirota bacterium]
MEKFRVLDVTGDVGLRVYGRDIKEAFINAASGMYSLVTNLDEIREEKTINLSIESFSLEGLFVSWLNELIFYFDTYGFIGKRVDINEFDLSVYNL